MRRCRRRPNADRGTPAPGPRQRPARSRRKFPRRAAAPGRCRELPCRARRRSGAIAGWSWAALLLYSAAVYAGRPTPSKRKERGTGMPSMLGKTRKRNGAPMTDTDQQKAAGVDIAEAQAGLDRIIAAITGTWPKSGIGAVKLPIGYFANVVDVGGVGLAICTDGVGSKSLIAQRLGKFDTIGIDCVAMNVNDLICLRAP